MFTSFNIFDFFSRYTFKNRMESYTALNDNNKPSVSANGTPSALPAPAAPENITPVKETAPKDNIEISGKTPETTKKSPVYTKGDLVPAKESAGDDEHHVEKSEHDDDDGLVAKIKSEAKLKLKMLFNLADFEGVVKAFAEDAEDGQIDTASYSNLNIGLRTELKAKVHIKEMYRNEEGEEGALREMELKQKSRSESLESSLLRTRGFEADMFYRESLKTSSKIKYSYKEGFLKVSRKMHMRYKQDFGMSLQSLNFFNSQAETLDQTGNLQGYLSSTEALVDSPVSSSDLLNNFFNTVESYLNGAEDKLVEKIDMFFENLASEMGMEAETLDSVKEDLLSNVESFFNRVEDAVSLTRNRYIAPAPDPEPVVLPPADELVGTADAVMA